MFGCLGWIISLPFRLIGWIIALPFRILGCLLALVALFILLVVFLTFGGTLSALF